MKTFEELGLSAEILRAITEMGYESPMPVQEQVIPHLLSEKKDVVALAQTGTGKTAAFGLPLIQNIDVERRQPQALIMCPTRELCLQISSDLADYSKYVNGLKVLPVYGGSSIESQINSLKRGVHIVVATPGRLLDLMNRRTVKLNEVSVVVMDEADEMLNMGFSESINDILAAVPNERNILLFSATMPKEIARIAKTYMKDPIEITVGSKNEGAKNVKHVAITVHAKDKYLALKRIADYNPNIYGIVFCRTRRETQEIADKLIQDGYNADSLHGELSQAQRDAVMQKFRIRNIQLLVATDVAARGLDVNDLTHIINYGFPDDIETYTHRSGRTARAGKKGTSIVIMHVKEKGKLREIERMIGKTFEKEELPTGKAICEKQLIYLADKIEKVVVDEEAIANYFPSILRKLEWLSTEDLLKRIISLEFNRMIEYYKGNESLDIPDERAMRESGREDRMGRGGREDRGRGDRNDRGDRGDRGGRGHSAEAGFSRLFINVGKSDGFFPNDLITLINENIPGRVAIGKIDLLPAFSFFEVDEKESRNVIESLKNIDLFGKRLMVEDASEKPGGGSTGGGGGYRGGNGRPRSEYKKRNDKRGGGSSFGGRSNSSSFGGGGDSHTSRERRAHKGEDKGDSRGGFKKKY